MEKKTYKRKKIRSKKIKKYNKSKRVSRRRRSKMKSKNRYKNGGNLGLGIGVTSAVVGLGALGLGAYLYKTNNDKKKQFESLSKLDLSELFFHANSMNLKGEKLEELKKLEEMSNDNNKDSIKNQLIKFIIDNGYKVPEQSDIE